MTTLTAGAQSSLTIPAGQTLSGTGNGLLVYGPGDRNGVPVGLTGSWAIGPVPAAQVVYLTATTDLVFTVGLPVAPGGGETTLPGMQSAFDAGTPAQQAAFQASVSGGGNAVDPTAWPMRLPTIMASPPVVTPGIANAASVIVGGATTSAMVAGAFRYLGGPVSRGFNFPDYQGMVLGVYPSGLAGTQYTSPSPVAAEFNFTSNDATGRFEIWTKGNGSKYRILLLKPDGNWDAFTNDETRSLPNDGSVYRDLVTLGAAGEYTVRLEWTGNARFYGITHTPADIVRATKARARRYLVVGDSYSEPTFSEVSGVPFVWHGWVQRLAYLTGYDMWSCASGGTGYIAENPGINKVRFSARLAQDCISFGAGVIFAGGINDMSKAYSTFTPEVDVCLNAVKVAGLPCLVLSPFWPNGINGYQPTGLQYRDKIKASASISGFRYLDLMDTGIPSFLSGYSMSANLTAAAASGAANISVSAIPGYFSLPNSPGKDKWYVRIGSGSNQNIREVQSISGTGPYTLGLKAATNSAFSLGDAVTIAGPGYLTGTGKQGATVGDGCADVCTGPDGTHPTRIGHHHIANVVAQLWSDSLSA